MSKLYSNLDVLFWIKNGTMKIIMETKYRFLCSPKNIYKDSRMSPP